MADMSGEDAFLASMNAAEYDPTSYDPADQTAIEGQEEEEEDDEDYDPSSFMPDQPQPSATPQPAAVQSQPPSQIASRTASPKSESAATQKPKTIGGFIEEDDDEDEEEQEHGTGTNGSLAQTPVQQQQNVQAVYNPPPTDLLEQDHAPSAIPTRGAPVQGQALPQSSAPVPSAQISSSSAALSKPRLPQDRVGQLEDRIADDPKGDVDAWLDLIALHRSKNKLDDARNVYDRFFEVFPTALTSLEAEQWVAYALMEQDQDDFLRLENIFNMALLKNYNVQLWGIYLDYIRRRNNVMTDATGQARQTITQAYDFALNLIGNDKDSGSMWQDYINFIKSGPGNPGGNGWQDAQKMDILRKAYQRAITVPMQATTSLWKEYDSFEMGLNKMTGRKFLQEKSPAYMTARTSYNILQKITQDLKRRTVPTLPPAPGCEGDDEYQQQVTIWQNWVEWEKEDPLVLKEEDIKAYRDRVLYVYRQATMALRFWPQIWYDAAEFCFDNEMETEANDFLAQGAAANPESCLLAFTRADRIEQTMPVEDGEESLVRRGDAVKEPYDNCLNALYGLMDKIKAREPKAIAQIKEYYESLPPLSREPTPEARDDDDEDESKNRPAANSREAEEQRQVKEVQNNTAAQVKIVSKTLSFVWIGLMRAMRRIQGKGKPDAPVGGLRNVFALARKRGRITSDVYVATALIEYHCYKDPAATKIFERGMKLFPEDELFAMEYLKHLIATNDVTNARAVFETTVSKLSAKPENIPRTKPLFLFIHEYESNYGELAQITKLEKRMADLFPEDPSLVRFGHRFRIPTFDPCTVRTIISPNAQTRPKGSEFAMPSTEIEPVPNPAVLSAATGYVQSPKRALDNADSDAEQPARKLARGESPLKGAAGRRQQQRQRAEGYGSQVVAPPPKPLPRDITLLLSMIPNASTYPAQARLNAESMVALIRGIDPSRAMIQGGGYGGGYSYGR
ncbi:Suf-domain-containing protein [Aureobasidium sp. EXF-3400]|nr:Suf-domain-containing protein [Aureobasidium sp. EXF-12344]KAI4776222.1 Suf-domain-containing protein [Aureobasidium sp. EXF-3400]